MASATTSKPGDPGPARVGQEKRGQDPHQRGLAGTVGAQQRQHPGLLGEQVDTGEGQVGAERLGTPSTSMVAAWAIELLRYPGRPSKRERAVMLPALRDERPHDGGLAARVSQGPNPGVE